MNRRHVVVTGASRGIGRAIALAMAREGDFVQVGYRAREEAAAEVLAEMRGGGGDGALLRLDLDSPAQVEESLTRIGKQQGPIDVLINNAAIVRDNFFALMSQRDWEHVVGTNLGGSAACCRAVVRSMWARRSGIILNVASLGGIAASPGQANYAAAKAGLLGLTRTLAAELAPRGIRVNALVPGLIDTGMTIRTDSKVIAAKSAAIPAGRLGHAEEIANAAVFLCSPAASYVVGHALVVDGGLSLGGAP